MAFLMLVVFLQFDSYNYNCCLTLACFSSLLLENVPPEGLVLKNSALYSCISVDTRLDPKDLKHQLTCLRSALALI